jgi:hypothetical protein
MVEIARRYAYPYPPLAKASYTSASHSLTAPLQDSAMKRPTQRIIAAATAAVAALTIGGQATVLATATWPSSI